MIGSVQNLIETPLRCSEPFGSKGASARPLFSIKKILHNIFVVKKVCADPHLLLVEKSSLMF